MANLPVFEKIKPGTQPEYLHPAYRSSVKRADAAADFACTHSFGTKRAAVRSECGRRARSRSDCAACRPTIGRTHCGGKDFDEGGRPVPGALIEIWQANAAGRYLHKMTSTTRRWTRLTGCGRTITDREGRYKFISVKPGAYPWGNHDNAWRPAHIHFSIFGDGLLSRLVTQMYFPGDPLLPFDPIYNCISDERAKQRLVSMFDWQNTHAGICSGVPIQHRAARQKPRQWKSE